MNPEEFDDENSDTDYPRVFHGREVEEFEGAAGGEGIENHDMGTPVLNSREVRDDRIRIVKVRGDSMAPTFEEGWKIAVDVTQTRPTNGDVVLVQRGNGTLIGRWHRHGTTLYLAKDNPEHEAIELTDDDHLVGVVAYVAWAGVKRVAAMTVRLPRKNRKA